MSLSKDTKFVNIFLESHTGDFKKKKKKKKKKKC